MCVCVCVCVCVGGGGGGGGGGCIYDSYSLWGSGGSPRNYFGISPRNYFGVFSSASRAM